MKKASHPPLHLPITSLKENRNKIHLTVLPQSEMGHETPQNVARIILRKPTRCIHSRLLVIGLGNQSQFLSP